VAGTGLRAVKERFGAAPAVEPAPATVAAVPPPGGRPAHRRPTLLRSKPVATSGQKQGQAVLSTLFAAAPDDPWRVSALLPVTDPLLVIAEPFEPDSTIYTEADSSVVPPELVRPRLPMLPPPGVRLEDLPRLELLVSPTGEVESVKLMSPGAGVHPAMMLSAVKNWRFAPATLAGQPVRYRHTLWLTR